jgi:hypothetical protein
MSIVAHDRANSAFIPPDPLGFETFFSLSLDDQLRLQAVFSASLLESTDGIMIDPRRMHTFANLEQAKFIERDGLNKVRITDRGNQVLIQMTSHYLWPSGTEIEQC